jgi:hypothetical protein
MKIWKKKEKKEKKRYMWGKINLKKKHMWETTNENPNTTCIRFCHMGQLLAN